MEGQYERRPVENDWHVGVLKRARPDDHHRGLWTWTNRAGVSWTFQLDPRAASEALQHGASTKVAGSCGSDCPYGTDGQFAFVVSAGSPVGFEFQHEMYEYVGEIPDDPAPAAPVAASACAPGELELEERFGKDTLAPMTKRVLAALFAAHKAYREGDFETAARVVRDLFAQYPPGQPVWGGALQKPIVHFGVPPGYYVLRMMSDVLDVLVPAGAKPTSTPPPSSSAAASCVVLNLTVVLVRQAEAAVPDSLQALQNPADRTHWHTRRVSLHPSLMPEQARRDAATDPDARPAVSVTTYEADVPVPVRRGLYWFGEYVHHVVLQGRGRLHVRCHWTSAVQPVEVSEMQACLQDYGAAVEEVPRELKQSTDWWLLLFPSCVPTDLYPDGGFGNRGFVTGGMGRAHRPTAPCFIGDDHSFLRKQPSMGVGPYSAEEQFVYLPQWFQHEFFHHVFAIWPEFALEGAKGHEWFDRSTWPADFEGLFEADYYHNALHRRVLVASEDAHPIYRLRPTLPLRLAVPPETFFGLTFERQPVENDWHRGRLSRDPDGSLRWTNDASCSWHLQPDGDSNRWIVVDGPYARHGVCFEWAVTPLGVPLRPFQFSFGSESYVSK